MSMAINGTSQDLSAQKPLPLQYEWSFWQEVFLPNNPNQQFSSNLTTLCNVKTVQEFWSAYNNIVTPELLPNRNSLHFFKRGIKPVWEDPKNEHGGAWSFKILREESAKVWPEVLMLCVGKILEESLAQDDELIGVSIGSRWNAFVIQIWNSSSKNANEAKVIEAVTKAVENVTLQQPYYKAHKDHSDFKKNY